jgi:hypothetical protein
VYTQLKTLFPVVFDTTQKLAFARMLAMEYHRSARRRRAALTARSGKTQTSSDRRDNARTLGKQIPPFGTDTSSTRTSQQRALVDHRGLSLNDSSDSEYSGLTIISMGSQMNATRTSQRRALVDHRGLSSSRSSDSGYPGLSMDSQRNTTSTRTSQRSALLDHRRLSSSHSSESEYSGPPEQDGGSPPQHPKSRDTGINEPSYLPAFGHGQNPQVPACESTMPYDEDRSTTTITSSSFCTSSPSQSMSYIHHFLQNCSPPLDHLLSRFVDLGFQNQGILGEVAYNWKSEERRELMRRLAPGPMGKTITEVELAAFERGFQALRSTGH